MFQKSLTDTFCLNRYIVDVTAHYATLLARTSDHQFSISKIQWPRRQNGGGRCSLGALTQKFVPHKTFMK